MGSIAIKQNKVLKLVNALVYPMCNDEDNDFTDHVELMHNYILNKGNRPIGPIIQSVEKIIDNNGEKDITIHLIMQTETPIHSVEPPYVFKNRIKLKNCMYSHFVGEERYIKYAHDKIFVEAFEKDIKLTGNSYTIYVDKADEDNFIVDVFMECEE